MAKFNINTFDPIYPEGNDKKGEIQLRVISDTKTVGEYWTEEMRLDFLPVFSNRNLDSTLYTNPVGRQTMYRIVKHDNFNLPWASSDPDIESSFLYPINPPTSQTVNWELFVIENTQKYNDFLNWYISNNLGLLDQLEITKVHIINSNIQYFERAGEHMFFQTYDVVFYGQQSPNPAIPPTPPPPPCDPYTNTMKVLSNATPDAVTPTVGLTGEMYATLLTNIDFDPLKTASWAYDVLNLSTNPFTPGQTYALKVNADPMPTGCTVNLSIRMGSPSGAPVLNITLTDAGIVNQFFPITCNPSSAGLHKGRITINSTDQTPPAPTVGRNTNVALGFQLYTDTCLIPT
jgi:hypothetical protein